jgi:Protein of unknown function (DUF3089)
MAPSRPGAARASAIARHPLGRAAALALLIVLGAASTAAGKTVWLCKPGLHPDPCTPSLSTTIYSPTLTPLRVTHPRRVKHPAIDCFYVYPTVSDQPTPNANLHIDPEERSIALYQAARYSQYCRVFAPMYRQLTLAGLGTGLTPAKLRLGLGDVRRAFRTYLRKYNHGRGFVLIGHSQGSFVLDRLIALDVDRKPAVRKRMVSAILLGGNILVKRGRRAGGDFKHIPACRSATELGCVIAFSTFDQPPPSNSIFGRTTVPGDQVLCTNPAALGGGSAIVDPIFPSQPFAPGTTISAATALLGLKQPTPNTVWSSEPGAYRAQCVSSGGANVLQLTALHGAQVAKPSPDPTWGLHLLDANIALGNLIAVVKSESEAFVTRSVI